jgi:hypothetical protein
VPVEVSPGKWFRRVFHRHVYVVHERYGNTGGVFSLRCTVCGHVNEVGWDGERW